MSDYDWNFPVLVVDLNNDLTPKDMKEINENFMSSRKTNEENVQSVKPSMFLATTYDKASEAWTRFSLNSMELKRLMAYAGSSANLLTKLIRRIIMIIIDGRRRGTCGTWEPPTLLPGDTKGNSEALRNKQLVDFDPLRCFVGDLEKEYPNTFKLWYDSLGGDAVGITWGRCGSKKRGREEEAEEVKDPTDLFKDAGKVGTGFVRGVYLLKAPRLTS